MNMMKVSKWGNSLAVRLPADLIRELNLKEGDYVARDKLAIYKARKRMTREEALKVMEESRLALPEGYKFDREDANAR